MQQAQSSLLPTQGTGNTKTRLQGKLSSQSSSLKNKFVHKAIIQQQNGQDALQKISIVEKPRTLFGVTECESLPPFESAPELVTGLLAE